MYYIINMVLLLCGIAALLYKHKQISELISFIPGAVCVILLTESLGLCINNSIGNIHFIVQYIVSVILQLGYIYYFVILRVRQKTEMPGIYYVFYSMVFVFMLYARITYSSVFVYFGAEFISALTLAAEEIIRVLDTDKDEKRANDESDKTESIYYKDIENRYQRSRELWHDMRNHTNMLNTLLANKDYDGLKEYIKSFSYEIDETILPYKTGNIFLDAVLGEKLWAAKKKGIHTEVKLCPMQDISIEPADLCALVSNLLDNAVEACRNCEPHNRFIRINVINKEGTYYISVSNYYRNDIETCNGRPVTNKINKAEHGIGLRSVERIAHKYSGSIAVDYDNNTFRITVEIQPKIQAVR